MHKQPRQKTLQSKTVNLEHVFKYPEAREAFEKLVGPDLDAKWLLKAIQTIVKILILST